VQKLLTQQFLPGPAWLHFLLLGAVLHVGLQWVFPPPKPVLGPPSEARLQMLYDAYTRMAGDMPSAAQIDGFRDRELREELLFRRAIAAELHLTDSAVTQRLIRNILFLFPNEEATPQQRVERALALNMHLTDEVIRRRLVQMMGELLVAAASLPEPSIDELQAIFDQRADILLAPATVSFQHVFMGDKEQAARDLLQRAIAQGLSPAQARTFGQPFLGGNAFSELTDRAVEGRFGQRFAQDLFSQAQHSENGWMGIVTSVFGYHVVYLEYKTQERSLTFEEVVDDLRWQEKREREAQALDDAVAELLSQYEVVRL